MIVPNPCKGVCEQHLEYFICKGCYRTKLEIRFWHRLSVDMQLTALEDCDRRKKLYGDINGSPRN